jgi:hypothetical protein
MRSAFSCGLPWRTDPGPCPVDDTPHTACTPESVARLGPTTARVRAPRSMAATLDALARRAAGGVASAPVVRPAPPVVSTKTYRRPAPGRRLKGVRGRD